MPIGDDRKSTAMLKNGDQWELADEENHQTAKKDDGTDHMDIYLDESPKPDENKA